MDFTSTGEFGMIQRIRRLLAGSDAGVPLSIGDDAAVLDPGPGTQIVVTTDALIESVHFDLGYTPLEDLGWKALAVNLSDLAAMAASPTAAVISMGLPKIWSEKQLDAFYSGLKQCGQTHACPIVGGDITASPGPVMLSVTALGEVPKNAFVTRSGARPDDLVCVSGDLGGSLAGLEALRSGPSDRARTAAVCKFLRPIPRIGLAGVLSEVLHLHAMIDISDGLASEIHHICRASRTGAVLDADRIPVHPEAVSVSSQTGRDPVDTALSSGEEYELLFVIPPEDEDKLGALKTDPPVCVIGRITDPSQGIALKRAGRAETLQVSGWDHFRR